jgi:CRP/FNR family transcriptional regulator, cyclic AMP receptor protein
MRRPPGTPARVRRTRGFSADKFLNASTLGGRVLDFGRGSVIYSQGDDASSVMYIREGRVKLSVVSSEGKEAVVGVLSAGDFFGEACVAGQEIRLSTATSMTATRVLSIDRRRMQRLLERQPSFAKRFITHILSRSQRMEEDLVDRLFNSAEKRFARALMLMARYGRADGQAWVVPRVSQETLAAMVGTTRPRINYFMNKFRDLGLIDYNGELVIRTALLSVVLRR